MQPTNVDVTHRPDGPSAAMDMQQLPDTRLEVVLLRTDLCFFE